MFVLSGFKSGSKRKVSLSLFVVLIVVLSGLGTTSADTDSPPILIAPLSAWEVTDYALSFTWQRQSFLPEEESSSQAWSINSYQIQVSNTADFAVLTIDEVQLAPGQDPSRVEPGDENDEEALEIMEMLQYWTEIVHMPKVLLSAGQWYWRVRSADLPDKTWSETIPFLVSADNTKIPATRPLSTARPLFSFDMYDSDSGTWGDEPDWSTYWGFFPDDLKPFVAFAVPHESWGSYDSPSRGSNDEVVTYAQFMQPLTELAIPVVIKTGGPDGDPQNYLSTTELENLYRNNPNVLGVVTGENTWQAIDGRDKEVYREQEVAWLQNVIRISGKYGRYVIAGEGAYEFAWDKYLGQEVPENNQIIENDYEWLSPQLLVDNPDTFIPTSKSNIYWSHHQMESAVFGAALSGLTSHHGIWAEAWYWNDAGFSNGVFQDEVINTGEFITMPQTFWLQTMLMGVAKGAVVYHFGGESGVSENRGEYNRTLDAIVDEDGAIYIDDFGQATGDQYTTFWDAAGHSTLGFERYVLPFIAAVTSGKLIPDMDEVRAEVKVAIDPGPVESDKGNFVCYGKFAPLYLNTYGIKDFIEPTAQLQEGDIEESNSGCRYELIPNNGRYYFIPVIPHPAEQFDWEGIQLVSLSSLQTTEAVSELFDAKYIDRFTGDAWINLVGNKLYVTNTNENLDVQENFAVSLAGTLSEISGTAIPHSYLIGSIDTDNQSLWLHSNAEAGTEYTDNRATSVAMKWTEEPQVIVIPESALLEKIWDDTTHTLSMSWSHDSGHVNVTVKADSGVCSECFTFDIDYNYQPEPLSDGLLVMRHLFGFTGDSLTSGATAINANRSSSGDISGYLNGAGLELDIDGNNALDPLTDGLLLIRYLFGFTGEALVTGAVGEGAQRGTAEGIEAYISARIPVY